MLTLRLRNLPEFIQLLLHGRVIHQIPHAYLPDESLSAVQSSTCFRSLHSLTSVFSVSFSCPLDSSLLAPPITTCPLSLLVLSHSSSASFAFSPFPPAQWPLPAHLPASIFIFFYLLPFFFKTDFSPENGLPSSLGNV